MIRSLSINNIALIDSLDIDFHHGLTVLSGETGSGKSIIIDSLSFVLGERADKSLIKHGEEVAQVTALFELTEGNVTNKLAEYGYDIEDGQLLLSRKMSVGGKNEIRIQGKPSTLAILRDITKELVDIFGQGEHLALLDERKQLSVLDSFCKFGNVPQKLAELKTEIHEIDKQIAELGGSDEDKERTLDFLRYQVKEITDAALDAEEENELVAKRKRMMNAEKISSAMSCVNESINGEGGATNALSQAREALRGVIANEPTAEELDKRLTAVLYEVSDIADCAEQVLGGMDFSEAEADKMEERLELIKSLKRKYGGSVEAVLAFCEQASAKIDKIVNATEFTDQLTEKRKTAVAEMYRLCGQMRAERQKTAKALAKEIMKVLAELDMKNTQFVVEFKEAPSVETYAKSPSANGYDNVRFLMSANAGEPLKPLAKVISGGEMSRFMLAVKNVTARAEQIPTMVFDEIDTGISGTTAQTVADTLASVSSHKNGGYQCIVITHLPQIVAMADNSFVISKKVADGKTHTVVAEVRDDDKFATEVARLMGGVGEHNLLAAKALIQWCRDYKSKL